MIKKIKIGIANHPEDDTKAIICVVCNKTDLNLYQLVIREGLASFEWHKNGNVLSSKLTVKETGNED